ncbi:MAG: DNA/RNA non-specific endonuclease [Clostridia bacterium]|nr:DNA/RNA non-specific endonuclease [Clostridia bacterium]
MSARKRRSSSKGFLAVIAIAAVLLVASLFLPEGPLSGPLGFGGSSDNTQPVVGLDEIPPYSGSPYVAINGNTPDFSEADLVSSSYESYAELDSLGRCGVCIASIGRDIMPTEDRGEIGSVKPTGWHTVKYDVVDGKYLYNRCHLIGFQLTGENANEENLITGTRYLNVQGMLPFENMVADYVKETGNHVLYRVTPIFVGKELVARGVQMEAYSVEDDGDGICFNVYCYNVQPGVDIDYATGESELAKGGVQTSATTDGGEILSYVLNTNTKKFHKPECSSVTDMNPANREDYSGTRQWLIDNGYVACGSCRP